MNLTKKELELIVEKQKKQSFADRNFYSQKYAELQQVIEKQLKEITELKEQLAQIEGRRS